MASPEKELRPDLSPVSTGSVQERSTQNRAAEATEDEDLPVSPEQNQHDVAMEDKGRSSLRPELNAGFTVPGIMHDPSRKRSEVDSSSHAETMRNPQDPLEAYDWDHLIARYQQSMSEKDETEFEIYDEFQRLIKAWSPAVRPQNLLLNDP
ncbi:MAG: hypothetical protein M4579_003241 [Chaenotheca gracillima]|nr:MAG: hypothetical protein M4579_003241 [Chaenotheca gracillima]